jgi:hypothetical protein
MEISRDVIVDLLPLYAAGEASQATKKLVDGYLQKDQDLKKVVDALRKSDPAMAVESNESRAELRSFQRTRLLVQLRSVLVGAAFFFTLAIFTFWWDGDSVTWLLQALPRVVQTFMVAAVVLWVAAFYFEILRDIVLEAYKDLFKKKK